MTGVSTDKPSPSAQPESIRRLPDGSVEIGWSDGVRSPYSLAIAGMKPVGQYAYSVEFSDGHSSGIYTLEYLRELG
jgi:DUF971 family protein